MTAGEILIVALAVVVGASLKSITGIGLPPVVIPVLAAFVGPQYAIVTMSLVTVVTNTYIAWHYRDGRFEVKYLWPMVLAGMVGTPLGVYLFTSLDSSVIGVVIGVTALLYVLATLAKPDLRLSETVARRAAIPAGLGAGVLQGATGLSGVVLASYIDALHLPQRAFVFTISILFQVFAVVQTIAFISAGWYTSDVVVASLLATAGAMLVLVLGARFLAVRVSQDNFRHIVLAVLSLSAVKLLVDAL